MEFSGLLTGPDSKIPPGPLLLHVEGSGLVQDQIPCSVHLKAPPTEVSCLETEDNS